MTEKISITACHKMDGFLKSKWEQFHSGPLLIIRAYYTNRFFSGIISSIFFFHFSACTSGSASMPGKIVHAPGRPIIGSSKNLRL